MVDRYVPGELVELEQLTTPELARYVAQELKNIGIRMTDLPLSPPRLSAAIDAAMPKMAAE